MRFRAESHLRRPMEFKRVRTEGRRYHCGGFVLWAAERPADMASATPGPRAGFVASRAAVGPAVARNRAKRRLRALFREHQDRIPDGTDLVFVARRSLLGLAPDKLTQRFLKACAHLFPAAASSS
jgi:ribonuclease P protein component